MKIEVFGNYLKMNSRKAIIISVLGTKLTLDEKKIIKLHKPWGVILFKRNCKTIHQTKKLISDIRKTVRDNKYPILIDEEGIKVNRLFNFFKNNYSQKYFGFLYKRNSNLTEEKYVKYLNSVIQILKYLKVNINTSPVLDMYKKKTNQIIGNRSYSNDVKVIKKLGKLCINLYKKNKISNVIKHIPGHGEATKDSHLFLPRVNKSLNYLKNNDFKCFSRMNSHFAMTAHILFSKIDKNYCASHSEKIIKNIIRKKIGFKGILISDDISMKALKYDLVKNALLSLKAGCNLVLYCRGNIKESKKLLSKMPFIDKFTEKKTSEFYRFLS